MKTIFAVLMLMLSSMPSWAAAPDGSGLTGVDAKIWNGLSRTSWIAQGEGARIVYALVDPNCPYSRDLYKKAQQVANPASVQIRWVPVGVLPRVTEDSRHKAAAAMKGGAKTLDAVMRGSASDVKPSQTEFAQVDSSADFLAHEIGKHVQPGVPKLVYVKDAGNEIRVFTGVPPQAELAKALR
jgi:thiol:disulfide interchange protein DsbG